MALAFSGLLAAGCGVGAVTGGSADIARLVKVVPEGSRCVLDRDAGEARFEVRLRNTSGDDHTVRVTPVRRSADGDVGNALESVRVSVPGMGEEDADYLVERVPDDLTACLVRIDDGDPIEITSVEGGG